MYIHSPTPYIKLLVCIIILMAGTHLIAPAQDQHLIQQFNAYSQQVMQEKLYVHTDKTFYLAGEICWFKIYNVDAFANKPLGISKVAYVELLDKNNKAILQAKVPLQEGDGNGSLQLPVSLGSGNYLLRAYTRWMKNFSAAYFFEKTVTIINAHKVYEGGAIQQKDRYDIQFFPEGGNLVNGIQSRIGFRVVDQNGKGISCTGTVVSDNSDTIVAYTTLKFGMGSFLLTPVQGHSYKAVLALPGNNIVTQPLPAAYNTGFVMGVTKANDRQLKITVQSPAGDASSPVVYLFAHTRGSTKAVERAELRNGQAEFLIDTAKLGNGISHFTVFNADHRPVCERLFFKKPVQHLEITAATSLPLYEPRRKINVVVAAADQDGKPASAGMSMSVYRVDSLTAPDETDISSYLWLSSDLVGNIEMPGWYFTAPPAEAEAAADNLMLTQGWRRFRWEDILQDKKPSFEFAPEYKGHIVKGKVLNNANGQPVKGVESYLSVAGTKTLFRGTFSDDSGVVKFEMNHFFGNNEIVVQTAGPADTSTHIEITSPFTDKYSGTVLPAFSLPARNVTALFNEHVAVQVQNAYSGKTLKQFKEPAIDTTPFYSKPDKAYLLDDYVRFTTVEEILREYVPEVNVRKRDGKFYLPVFDNVRREFFRLDPLILLDGLPVLDADKIMSYDPLKIRKMEVVARMYFYGNMFFDGIINFITYNGDTPGYELDPRATVIDYETLQKQREFFSPVYETREQVSGRLPDFRNLLYWSPAVRTDKDGKNEVSFYTSDITGRFAVVLQGIAADGKTGSRTIFFEVKEDNSTAREK